MPSPTRVPLIYGAAAFGVVNGSVTRIHTLPECQAILDVFLARGHNDLDTSRIYGKGTSEEYLGQLDIKGARLDTKIFPVNPGDHSPEKLLATFEESRRALKQHKINVFYLHKPDRSVPFEETLRAINDLHKQGLIQEFGLSNFNAWEVVEIWYIAKANGWVLPTVYQGLYNAVERNVEPELMPCLRKFGIRFYAYSPLAGGLFAGTIQTPDDFDKAPGSRWDVKSSQLAAFLQAQYAPLLPVFSELKVALEKHNVRLSEAAQRWLQHHSALGPQDGVIIGASSMKQLEMNMTDCEGGPLPDDIVNLIDEGWKKVKGQTRHYAF